MKVGLLVVAIVLCVLGGLLLFVGVLLAFSASSAGTHEETLREPDLHQSGMFMVGEELTYNVSYAFLDIGQIRIKVLQKISDDTSTSYEAIAYIDSYSGIPFVNLHTIYESRVDERVFSRWFRGRVREQSRWYTAVYEYDYEGRKMYFQKGWLGSKVVDVRDSLTLDTLYQDGLSLYYYARQHLQSNRRVVVPTIIQEEKVKTVINFLKKPTSIKIDAVDYPIDVIEFEGQAEFVGIFGFTGAFQGWFSNDDARVPIMAKMKVIIGNVRIELMKWTRPGWTPPQYVERPGK